ncbi:eRF1-like protein [Winogradskyella epiphytica]|uniref:ERF1-like protein n=1 Tax=Winogradskyella epiphytica TaxID=262005 RepID=A0A2V4WYL3_9FLAO|nr:hypothetical protein [Winogradskyella epiphytica]PYE82746.1 eRF1-like protein [Winogradskyella epiphytica]GGW53321.1 hypothetical protein GCM10008085_00500 [Winogradskyella epiphytica]
MNTTLKKLKNISSENCITIIMNSHRTKPGYLKDELTLKNLIKEAENRLNENTVKKEADALVDKLQKLANDIDHSHNLDSLMLFVNKDTAKVVKLPIEVTDRVIIDNNFATRDLVRAMHIETNYFVLVLSQEKVRLIEAFNDKVVQEFDAPFPMENTFPMNKPEVTVSSRKTNLIAEFFNQVDKAVNLIRKENPLPVLICTVEENYAEYLKIADEKHSIFTTYLNKNRIAETDHAIVTEAYKIVETYKAKRNKERKAELDKAISENKFLSNTYDIYKAINEGRIQTLFIEEGLFQPAIITKDDVVYVSDFQRNDSNVIDDVYDELIEMNMRYGGDVVFMPQGKLDRFNGFGAITRY